MNNLRNVNNFKYILTFQFKNSVYICSIKTKQYETNFAK